MRRSWMLGLALLVLLSGAAMAEDAKAPLLNPELLNVQEHQLDNGLKILMLEDHSAPLVHYMVYYNVGSRHEDIGKTGLAHFFEHYMFRGSKKYGSEEHAHIVKANGGTLNANTGHDRTAYFENISSDKLELAIHLEAERMANLDIKESTYKTEQNVVIEERRERVDNDMFGEAIEEVMANSYRAHPYGNPILGWMDDMQSWVIDDLKDFYNCFYAPNNAMIVLVGDFEPKNAIELIEKYYGNIPQSKIKRHHVVEEPVQKGERRVKLHRTAQLPFLFAAYHIPGTLHEDMAALEVVQKILSDGQTSRIFQKMVYEEQKAAFAGGFLRALKDPGLFIAYLGVNPGVEISEAENTLYGIIEKLGEEGPTDHELQKAKNQLEADYIFGLSTLTGKAYAIGETAIINDGDYTPFLNQPEKYQAVTAEDIKRVVKTYLTDRSRTVVELVPEVDMSMMQQMMGGGQ